MSLAAGANTSGPTRGGDLAGSADPVAALAQRMSFAVMWVVANHFGRIRTRSAAARKLLAQGACLPPPELSSLFQEALATAWRRQELPFIARPFQCGADLSSLQGHTLGLVLVRLGARYNVLDALSPVQQHWLSWFRIWQGRRYPASTVQELQGDLGHVEVIDFVALARPRKLMLDGWLTGAYGARHSLFCSIALASAQSMLNERAASGLHRGRTLQEALQHWKQTYPVRLDSVPQVAIRGPVPEALLWFTSLQRQRSFLWPVDLHTARRRGSGLSILEQQCGRRVRVDREVDEILALNDDDPACIFNAESCRQVADFIRREHSRQYRPQQCNQAHDEAEADEVLRERIFLVRHFDRVRDDLIWSRNTRMFGKKWGYKIMHLLQCIILSKAMRDEGQMITFMRRCLEACLPSSMVGMFINDLKQERTVPSPTTIRRHRLTLHCAWMLQERRHFHQLLTKSGGVFVYITADSSPIGGIDWVLVASSHVPKASIVGLWKNAHNLIQLRSRRDAEGELTSERDREEERACLSELESALRIHQWVPVGVGSAFAGVANKLHAALHALRLFSFSWGHACSFMSSGVTTATIQIERAIPLEC